MASARPGRSARDKAMPGKNQKEPAVLLLLILAYFVIAAHAQQIGESTPRKFDEYVLEGDQQWLRLDRFVAQLKREPKKRAYVIVYAARKISGPGVYYNGEDWTRWVWHNMKARRLPEDQFVSIYGGLRERATIEFWIVSPGGSIPTPTPTATELVVCPSVTVLGDVYVRRRDKPLTFKTDISAWGSNSFPGLSFNWTVSSGRIVSGQGSDAITVDVSQSSEVKINAAVEVIGLSGECQNRHAATTAVGVVPYKFDEFGKIHSEDLMARLDNLAIYLQKDAALRAQIITYRGRRGRLSQAKAWAEHMVDYLVNTRGLERTRVDKLEGGYREELSGELWLSVSGAAAPKPSPSVDPKYVHLEMRKPKK